MADSECSSSESERWGESDDGREPAEDRGREE